ncbi:hypothetical protein ENUP19_0046G0080 [Entamoeba nuttalli]|uniref:RBR-type E3 ubiquitin transferase n=1 Tax=Entamoeba nuttalli TaxID=412467 RepID=A0ABQ0DAP6_9EUKA
MNDMTHSIYKLDLNEFVKLSEEKQKEILCECVENYRKEYQKNNKEMFCCSVCYEEYTYKETFINECGHRFCIKCWRENIIQQIQSDWHQVHCMEQGCNCIVKIEDIMTHCLIQDICMLNMYCERLTFKTFEDNICECPKCRCEMITFEKEYKTTCPRCKYLFCRKCGENWHEGKSCDEWKRNKEQEQEDLKWINQNTKKCPSCGDRIQKNGGCNHMTCKCGYEFCWLCGVKYTPNHWTNNTTGCKQFT